MTNKDLNAPRPTAVAALSGVIMTGGGRAANLEWLQARCVFYSHPIISAVERLKVYWKSTAPRDQANENEWPHGGTFHPAHAQTVCAGRMQQILRFVIFYFAECRSDVNNERRTRLTLWKMVCSGIIHGAALSTQTQSRA